MAQLFAQGKDLYIHLDTKDISRIEVHRVKGGGRNYYAQYDHIYGNKIPIPESLAFEVIDEIKKGKICDVYHSFFEDNQKNF